MTSSSNLRRASARALALALALGLFACDDADPTPPATVRGDGGDTAPASDASADASDVQSSEVAPADGGDAGPAAPAPGLAVLSSDRKSSSLSLLTADGRAVAREHCLHSGSASPKLSAALSGDVVLPSGAQPSHEIALVDRKNSTVTWAAPGTCEVLRQLNVGTGFASNPYDLIGVAGNKGYVPRYDSNPGNPAEGNDVLVIDTALGLVKGRIDLRATVTPTTPPAMPLLPRPTRGVAVAGKVYVALNHLSEDYSAAGEGRLVVIDPQTDTVVDTIALPGLKNCGAVATAPDHHGNDGILVGCNGPFSDGPAQIDSAGIAWVDPSSSPAGVTVVKAAGFARPVSGFDVAALDHARAITVVPGEFMPPPNDAAFAFDFVSAGGAPFKLYEGDAAFTLAVGADRARGHVYVLDASKTKPRVQVFGTPLVAGAAPLASFAANPTAGLPPRQLGRY